MNVPEVGTSFKTVWVLIVTAVVLIAWDLYARAYPGGTISEVLLWLSAHPVVPFLSGVLMGHLHWPQIKEVRAMKSAFLALGIAASLAIAAWAGTTIRSQDLPPSLTISSSFTVNGLQLLGRRTNAQIQALTCSAGIGACLVSSSDEGDLYINFGTNAGEFRNSRTGKLP